MPKLWLPHSRAVDRGFGRRRYPGIGAEERGQAEAIARSTDACMALGVPNVAIVTGEGMSGGAIAITTANRVLMFEHAIYSVISPESGLLVLWRDGTKGPGSRQQHEITAQDMLRFGRDRQHPEGTDRRRPPRPRRHDCSHRRRHRQAFDELRNLDSDAIRKQRRQKFLDIGRKAGLSPTKIPPECRPNQHVCGETVYFGPIAARTPILNLCSSCLNQWALARHPYRVASREGQRIQFNQWLPGHER